MILEKNFKLLCLPKTNVTNLRSKMLPMPGIEPGPWRWERQILATRPHGILILIQTQVDVPKQEARFLKVTKL